MAVKISGVDLSANTTANIGQAGSNGGTYTVHITVSYTHLTLPTNREV